MCKSINVQLRKDRISCRMRSAHDLRKGQDDSAQGNRRGLKIGFILAAVLFLNGIWYGKRIIYYRD